MARSLKISNAARRDLDDLYDYGAATFGYRQADKYAEQILDAFRLIAAFPAASPSFPPNARVRGYVCGSHRILFEDTGDTVLVLRVLHARQLPPDLA